MFISRNCYSKAHPKCLISETVDQKLILNVDFAKLSFKSLPKHSICETVVQKLTFKPKSFSDEMKGELTRRARGATERSVEWSSKVWIQI
jgi:hypothetical protein